jgi:two-component system, LytTR family, response regulator LytT
MSRTLRVMVVDDEPLARDELRFLLGEVGGVEVVGEAASSTEAIARFEESRPDAVFVDLRMPGPDGLALSEALLSRDPRLAIVVVSAHDEGAMRGYDVGVVDYLLKPARLPRVRTAVERIAQRVQDTSGAAKAGEEGKLERLAVRRRGQYVVLDVRDVIYFEMKDELVWAVTETDRFALDLTLGAVEARLPEGFFRSHRGFLVRLDRIAAMEPSGAGTYELILSHPERPRVPLARERARALRELIPIAG